MAARKGFNSGLGFIFAAIGSAVGIGNLWRFPYLTATSGGGSFVALYLLMLFLIGIPALYAELAVGRKAQQAATKAFPLPNGGNANWIGYVGVASAIILLSYYSVIAGWVIRYLADAFSHAYFTDASSYYSSISLGPGAILTHAAFIFLTFLIVLRGVSGGIEKANLVMMPMLFATVILLAIYGLAQDGSMEGVKFYLKPNFSDMSLQTISDAAGQTFFSIGLGLGTMLTYGSYIGKKTDLKQTGKLVAFSDTGVALLAGFMVFPLLFALGLQDLINPTNSGSVGGLFVVLPTAFGKIGGGLAVFLAIAFFLMLLFAALSSAVSLMEVPIAALVDTFGVSRTKASIIMALGIYALGVPSAISTQAFSFFDVLISNILLLFGGLMVAIYSGWIRPSVLDELQGNRSERSQKIIKGIIRYPLTIALAALLVLGIYNTITGGLLG